MKYPKDIAREIMRDISDRSGIGDELNQIDDTVREEILEAWADIIRKGQEVT
jgi:hypothetical protein